MGEVSRFWRHWKIIMALDPYHRYWNEEETATKDIYDDFKLKKPFSIQGL